MLASRVPRLCISLGRAYQVRECGILPGCHYALRIKHSLRAVTGKESLRKNAVVGLSTEGEDAISYDCVEVDESESGVGLPQPVLLLANPELFGE